MWSEDEIKCYLKKNLKESRYNHSLSVSKTAEELALKYGVDIEKAKIAGLVHDCAKNLSNDRLLELVAGNGLQIETVYKKSPQLLHGVVASIIARDLMEIRDEDILNAMAYHTTGRKNMSILEKIIYLADYVEPLRDFPGVEELRNTLKVDLTKALILSFDATIKLIISRGDIIHKDTIEARNYLIYSE